MNMEFIDKNVEDTFDWCETDFFDSKTDEKMKSVIVDLYNKLNKLDKTNIDDVNCYYYLMLPLIFRIVNKIWKKEDNRDELIDKINLDDIWDKFDEYRCEFEIFSKKYLQNIDYEVEMLRLFGDDYIIGLCGE